MAFLGVLALVLAAGAMLLPFATLRPLLLGASSGLLALVVLKAVRTAWGAVRATRDRFGFQSELENMQAAAVLTDKGGRILAANSAAAEWVSGEVKQTVAALLSHLSTDPERVVAQLEERVRIGAPACDLVGIGELRTRVDVRRVGNRRLAWTFLQVPLNPDIAVISVRQGAVSLNEAAKAILSDGDPDLASHIGATGNCLGTVRRFRSAQGGDVSVRLLDIQRLDESADIAVLPLDGVPDEVLDAGTSALAAPDLLSVLPVPMLKVDAAGMLLEVNREARSVLALEGESLPPLFELVEGMGRPISDWLSDAAIGRGLLKPEIVRAVIPGQELYLQITLGRTVENGKAVLVGILNDATELKTLEAQFVQSQKMQAIGQLAGGVAHDFNNLLTAISGHCDLLLLRHEASDPDYADLIQISQNANRAASLVGQLLAFSRKQNLKPQALDLRDTMADLAHLLNRLIGERVQLEVTHAPGPQMIRADRRQLEQVIVNLVVNARDAMKEGGTITVETRTESIAEEVLRDRARLLPGDYVVIEVADTGMGIPEEVLPKIFEPFFTTKKTGEGTGLGLSTAYGIVKQTGGFIFVESELGEGTTFSLYFPAASVEAKAPVVEASSRLQAPPRKSDASILLVEDEAPVRAFACRALRLRGYNVIEAANAEEALEILADEKLTIDLFVTDVIMPGMDGPTWVRRALKDRPDTGVVFMSGYAEEGRAEKQARIPNSDFLPKPFSLHQLTSLVQEKLQ